MITALDHLVLVCPDIESAEKDYFTLLGEDPVWRSETDETTSVVFAVGNTALELLAPQSEAEGDTADRLRKLSQDRARLTTLVYQSDNLAEDHHLLGRRGLSPGEMSTDRSQHGDTGEVRTWQRFRVPDTSMAGIKTFVLQTYDPYIAAHPEPGSVAALDHVVINTPNPQRAVANYGARLGLRFALDRTAEEWKTRFLFFRLGGLTLEVIHRLDAPNDPEADDYLWGLTWEADDLEAAHERLSAAGLDLSEIRTGRKPGTHVFTVREGTQGIPTLFIAHSTR